MPEENFSRAHVEEQAEMVKAYWRRRGYKVQTFVEPITGENRRGHKVTLTGFRLVTDMINGLPAELHERRMHAGKASRHA